MPSVAEIGMSLRGPPSFLPQPNAPSVKASSTSPSSLYRIIGSVFPSSTVRKSEARNLGAGCRRPRGKFRLGLAERLVHAGHGRVKDDAVRHATHRLESQPARVGDVGRDVPLERTNRAVAVADLN